MSNKPNNKVQFKEKSNLKLRNSHENSMNPTLKSNNSSVQLRNKEMMDEIMTLKDSLMQTQKKVSEFEEENKKLKGETETQKYQINELNDKLNQYKENSIKIQNRRKMNSFYEGENESFEDENNSSLRTLKDESSQKSTVNTNKEEIHSLLIKKNQNMQEQITLLTKRLKDYEEEYINKNNIHTKNLMSFSLIENNLKSELQKKEGIIQNLVNENDFLKTQINDMEASFIELSKQIKTINSDSFSNSKNFEIQSKKLLYENEKLTKENEDLLKAMNKNRESNELNLHNYKAELNELKSKNKNLNDIVSKLNNQIYELNKNFNKQNLMYFESTLKNLNDMNNNLNSSLNACITTINKTKINAVKEQQRINNNEHNEIVNDLILINNWIDTYLTNFFDKNFEVPSLINVEDELNTSLNDSTIINNVIASNLNTTKKLLEKAKDNIYLFMHNKDKEIMDYKVKEQNMSLQINEQKKEMNNLKKELLNIKNINLNLSEEKAKAEGEISQYLNRINVVRQEMAEENDKFNQILSSLYQSIYEEFNGLTKDFNFKAYHSKFILFIESEKDRRNYQLSSIQELLSLSLNKLLEFINELKYDYVETKNENVKLLNEKLMRDTRELDKNIRKKGADDTVGDNEGIVSENNLLKNKIKLLNDCIEQKNIKEKDLLEQINYLNSQLNQFKIENERYKLRYENELPDNCGIKEEIEDLKNKQFIINNKLNNKEDIELKLEKLTKDYQRIYDENLLLREELNRKRTYTNENDNEIEQSLNSNNSLSFIYNDVIKDKE